MPTASNQTTSPNIQVNNVLSPASATGVKLNQKYQRKASGDEREEQLQSQALMMQRFQVQEEQQHSSLVESAA